MATTKKSASTKDDTGGTSKDADKAADSAEAFRKLYADYAASLSHMQTDLALEYGELVASFGEKMGQIAANINEADPTPAYTAEVAEAARAADATGLLEANRKLVAHLQELGSSVRQRYEEAVQALMDDASELYRKVRSEYVDAAAKYAEEVHKEWDGTDADHADPTAIAVLQHGLTVGAAARTLEAHSAR